MRERKTAAVTTGENPHFSGIFTNKGRNSRRIKVDGAVKEGWCNRQNRKVWRVALRGGVVLLESMGWEWRRHVCECGSINDFGFGWLFNRALSLAHGAAGGQKPVLAVVAASKGTGGAGAPQLVALVEVTEAMQKHCLRLQLSGGTEPGMVARGGRIEAGTLMALGKNGSIKWCCSANTFEFDCLSEKVSPAELDLPHEWIPGSFELI